MYTIFVDWTGSAGTPKSLAYTLSEPGLLAFSDLIQELKTAGIEFMVTISKG